MKGTPPIYIAAKTYGHASHCAKVRGLGPLDWLFLNGDRWLRETRGAKVILCGDWDEHPEARDIELAVRDRECVVEVDRG